MLSDQLLRHPLSVAVRDSVCISPLVTQFYGVNFQSTVIKEVLIYINQQKLLFFIYLFFYLTKCEFFFWAEFGAYYLVVVGIVLRVLLLQQLPLSPLLLQGLLDERGHLTLLTWALSANHEPATTRCVDQHF